jgi:polyhydroxyalkanoate synthesis regulator phasin
MDEREEVPGASSKDYKEKTHSQNFNQTEITSMIICSNGYLMVNRRRNMLEEIKKDLLTGLGAVVLSKEKVEKITQRLVDQSKLSKEEARKLNEELFSTGEKHWSELESSVTEAIKRGISSLDIASKTEVEDLKRQVTALTRRMTVLEDIVEDMEKS